MQFINHLNQINQMQMMNQSMLPNNIVAGMFKNKININLINSNNFAGVPFMLPPMGMPQGAPMMNSLYNGQMVNNLNVQYNNRHAMNQKQQYKKKEDKPINPNSMLNYIYGGQVIIFCKLSSLNRNKIFN
jgi:gamma-glutamyl-gamma-aminobutyrate hydrolase PuuD